MRGRNISYKSLYMVVNTPYIYYFEDNKIKFNDHFSAHTYLKPCTGDTLLPSFNNHVIVGGGLPCAEHDKCVPELLLNRMCGGGSCINVGTLCAPQITVLSRVIHSIKHSTKPRIK